MLEAIRERSKGWLAKTILALITVPFALWGIESYLQQAGSNVAVAKVDDDTITLQQYSNALQGVRNQLQADGKVDRGGGEEVLHRRVRAERHEVIERRHPAADLRAPRDSSSGRSSRPPRRTGTSPRSRTVLRSATP